MHSIYSDGTNTPAELVSMAVEQGLRAIALTDHDTVGGIMPLLDAAKDTSVEVVPGIELSAACEKGTMHILGYFIDHTCEALLEKIAKVREGRALRNEEILRKLNKLGYVLKWSEVQEQAGVDVVGRPHFADALVRRGYVKSRKAAFDLLLAKGRRAYAERYRYSAMECIKLIRKAGGVPVLAHPSTINLLPDQLKGVVGGLAECGLAGIEVYYSSHQPETVARFSGWAKEYGLVCTGGTDFHGENTPDLKVGIGFGHLQVPDDVLDQLKARLK